MVTGENVGQIAAEAIRRGATDYVVKFGDYLFTIPLVVEKNLTVAKVKRENESLRSELERALREVREKNVQLEQSLQRVEEMAATDPLTGLYNRRHFGKVLEQLFAEAQRYDQDLSCVMIDLDGYKQLNDAYGHQVGDQILVVAGRVITREHAARWTSRPATAATSSSCCCRTPSADEAAAGRPAHPRGVPPGVAGHAPRATRARRCRSASARSRGDDPATAEQLVAAADAALYQAKEAGRNRIVISQRDGEPRDLHRRHASAALPPEYVD